MYSRIIVNMLKGEKVARYRRKLLAGTGGKILEIGVGGGANLDYYPRGVEKIWAVDKSNFLQKGGVEVEFVEGGAEKLPFGDGEFDCVVSSFTLCSVSDLRKVLGEVRRVLKPGGRFVFLEHVAARDEKGRRSQRRWRKVFLALGDGCHVDRDILGEIKEVFSEVRVREFRMEVKPMAVSWWCLGEATV